MDLNIMEISIMLSRLFIMVVFCAVAVGCSMSEYDIVPVSGVITYNGKPLPNVSVAFQPANADRKKLNPGPGSFGTTNDKGEYTLEVVGLKTSGAIVGENIVTAWYNVADDAPMPGPPIPNKYKNNSVKYEVPKGGTTEANFDLMK
jgi:hypothetical protein